MKKRATRGPSQRQLRVGEELRHALSQILEREPLRDPGLVGVSITVTEVRASPDLRHATVYVMPLGGEAIEEVVTALGRARPFLRRRLAPMVRLKYVPDLVFRSDESFDESARVTQLLGNPSVVRDLIVPDRDDDDGA